MTSHYFHCCIRQTDQASVKGKRDVSLHNLATMVSRGIELLLIILINSIVVDSNPSLESELHLCATSDFTRRTLTFLFNRVTLYRIESAPRTYNIWPEKSFAGKKQMDTYLARTHSLGLTFLMISRCMRPYMCTCLMSCSR